MTQIITENGIYNISHNQIEYRPLNTSAIQGQTIPARICLLLDKCNSVTILIESMDEAFIKSTWDKVRNEIISNVDRIFINPNGDVTSQRIINK